MYEQELQGLGFSEKESKVFLALNQYGAMPASTIARVTGIKRTSVYDLINSLEEKNVISSYRQGNYTYFIVDDLNKLYLFEKEKLNTAKKLVENLQDQGRYQQNIQVTYYRGHEGYFEVYREMLRVNPREILCWVDFRFLSVFKPEEEGSYLMERVRKNIPARIMMIDSPGARAFKQKDKQLKRETRILPPQFTFETTAFLYDGYIALFDFHEPITAIRIQHAGIYKMFLQIFDMHWGLSGLPT